MQRALDMEALFPINDRASAALMAMKAFEGLGKGAVGLERESSRLVELRQRQRRALARPVSAAPAPVRRPGSADAALERAAGLVWPRRAAPSQGISERANCES